LPDGLRVVQSENGSAFRELPFNLMRVVIGQVQEFVSKGSFSRVVEFARRLISPRAVLVLDLVDFVIKPFPFTVLELDNSVLELFG
jgi:hypothetical protein